MKSQRDFFLSLATSMSRERLEAYRRAGADGALLARYLWNVMLSEALYPSMQYLEVALRNSLHTSISTAYGRDDWYDSSPSILAPRQQDAVADAKNILVTDGKLQTPGRVVAELTFGFWTSLFNVAYETKPTGNPLLWPRLLAPVFPHMPRRIRTRRMISRNLNDVRKLRNRVFHHEPIWHYARLAQQHAAILTMIGWINRDVRDMATLIDRFPDIHATGYARCRSLPATITA